MRNRLIDQLSWSMFDWMVEQIEQASSIDLFVLFNMVFWRLYPSHKERAKKLEQERKRLHK